MDGIQKYTTLYNVLTSYNHSIIKYIMIYGVV